MMREKEPAVSSKFFAVGVGMYQDKLARTEDCAWERLKEALQ